MKTLCRAVLCAAAVFSASGYASAADETVTANIVSGGNATSIAAAFVAAWSQAGDFNCSSNGNRVVITNTNGDCDEPVSEYTFSIASGTLNQNHTVMLRIQCASPTVASMDFDSAGFVVLGIGANVFVAGSDTITVNFQLRPPCNQPGGGCPAVSPNGTCLLVVMVLAAGFIALRRTVVHA